MNEKEAIFYIEELQKTYASMDKKVVEAVGMAIEALQFQDIMINSSKTVKLAPDVIEDTRTMIRLTDLQGYNYYLTEANMPPGYQRGAELTDVVEFIQGSGKDWVTCYIDQSLRDRVVIRADQIYRAEEVSDQNRRVSK